VKRKKKRFFGSVSFGEKRIRKMIKNEENGE
jgi:hypothetical protein